MHEYNDDFYAYIGSGARRSAENIVPLVKGEVAIATMLDVGGGKGVWGKVWEEHGVFATVLDGDYVTEPLVEDFRPQDLSQPFDLGQRFDLVQTLEVAEHLPETSARDFVASIARHGDIVLFSAAVPGQGGEHHVNEQPLEYWRKLFAEAGYACFDALRPHLRDNKDVMPWYRYNILLFANDAGQARLSDRVLAARTDHVKDDGDLAWTLRKALVRVLPRRVVDAIAAFLAKRKR